MRFGIAVNGNRVAPRCTFAEKILLLDLEKNCIKREKSVRLERNTSVDLVSLLQENAVETLVCGGISNDTIASVHSLNISVIDNVSSTLDDIRHALLRGTIHPGYGFGPSDEPLLQPRKNADKAAPDNTDTQDALQQSEEGISGGNSEINCLTCRDRVCLAGEICSLSPGDALPPPNQNAGRILDVAAEVALENEPQLCRISELVYFCLDMNYSKLGVAFCHDLMDATQTLVSVLKRFFSVLPVCCKIVSNPERKYSSLPEENKKAGQLCNPRAQADVLNRWGSDLNVMVGLCVGADCIFNQASKAPVTTLFVKDKSLANNPIGALYSHYYLEEISESLRSREYTTEKD